MDACAVSGIRVDRSYPDFVTRSEIAERLNVSRQAVDLWARGERKKAVPFPAPISEVAGGFWLWRDVVDWASDNRLAGAYAAVAYPTFADHVRIDAELLDRR